MDAPDSSATPVWAGVINQSFLPRAVIRRISASGPADAPVQSVDIDTQVVQEAEQLELWEDEGGAWVPPVTAALTCRLEIGGKLAAQPAGEH